jgi:serine/threonine protein kinase
MIKYPETISRDARHVIQKLIEVDPRRRQKASELMREPWIRCQELQLSIFETAGTLFRANSVDARESLTCFSGSTRSKADGFNRNITKLHNGAVDHLKSLGYAGRAIEESLKQSNQAGKESNEIYKMYREHIDSAVRT